MVHGCMGYTPLGLSVDSGAPPMPSQLVLAIIESLAGVACLSCHLYTYLPVWNIPTSIEQWGRVCCVPLLIGQLDCNVASRPHLASLHANS